MWYLERKARVFNITKEAPFCPGYITMVNYAAHLTWSRGVNVQSLGSKLSINSAVISVIISLMIFSLNYIDSQLREFVIYKKTC